MSESGVVWPNSILILVLHLMTKSRAKNGSYHTYACVYHIIAAAAAAEKSIFRGGGKEKTHAVVFVVVTTTLLRGWEMEDPISFGLSSGGKSAFLFGYTLYTAVAP